MNLGTLIAYTFEPRDLRGLGTNQRRLAIIFRRGGVVALRPANLTWTPRIICRLCPTEGLLKLRSSAELYVTDRVELISPASQAG